MSLPWLATAIVLTATPGVAAVPYMGACQYVERPEARYLDDLKIDWQWGEEDRYGTASIAANGKTFMSNDVYFRPHDEGFKGTIRYEDDIMGPSEVVVFHFGDNTRMAVVTYESGPNGLYASTMTGFEDAIYITR